MDDNLPFQQRNDLSIVLCGRAGQGIQTVEHLLTRILKLAGYNVFATKEYMSRIRGGTNSTQIRISSSSVRAPVSRIDILIPLNRGAIQHVERRISAETIILAEKLIIEDDFDPARHKFIDAPFTKTASEIGNRIYSNVVAAGTIAGLFGIELQTVSRYVKQFFSTKPDDVVQKNLAAAKRGLNLGTGLVSSAKIKFEITNDANVKDQILVSGAEAVALGAIAGGCDFISSYPMSPSTGVLVFLAGHAKDFGIVAEQAEDEIAAVNMAIGAWYAGARAMVTTSQRPGPATGLPTRTEQADLELALYAGHGEFPRIVLAPGKIEDGFYRTQKAFN
jgi:2-oxoglutarate ferredoxin oxidoreductase subunit alpha